MKSLNDIKTFERNNLDTALKKDYSEALKNDEFKELVVKLKVKDDIE